MKKIFEKPWSYSLYEEGEELYLSVLCGSVGLYEIKIKLNKGEKEEYYKNGEEFIKNLSSEIRKNPNSFSHRNY